MIHQTQDTDEISSKFSGSCRKIAKDCIMVRNKRSDSNHLRMQFFYEKKIIRQGIVPDVRETFFLDEVSDIRQEISFRDEEDIFFRLRHAVFGSFPGNALRGTR